MTETQLRARWQELKTLLRQAERDWSIADGKEYPILPPEHYRQTVETLRLQEREAFRTYMETASMP